MKINVIEDKSLSKKGEKRYVVIDEETGEILDDAQGYGYKDIRRAYAAYTYKNCTKEQKDTRKQLEQKVKKWMKEHKDFVNDMNDMAFEIAKGDWGPNTKFNTVFVKGMLSERYIYLEDFTAGDLLKVWKKS